MKVEAVGRALRDPTIDDGSLRELRRSGSEKFEFEARRSGDRRRVGLGGVGADKFHRRGLAEFKDGVIEAKFAGLAPSRGDKMVGNVNVGSAKCLNF